MSYNSERVKAWRRRTKQRMIDSMGGECQICSYSKCGTALAFHHLDPDEKDFGFGDVRANIKSWVKIVEELRKCILLCHNCHSEIHEGVIQLPTTFARFDESYLDYKHRQENLDDCPVCGDSKEMHNKTCSRSCAAKLPKFNWGVVDLQNLLKKHTVNEVALKLGVSHGAVWKRRKKLRL